MFGLRDDNIRNELRLLLQNSFVSDEDILKNLLLAISDEQEHSANFNKKRVDINSVEPVDAIPKSNPSGHQKSVNPIIAKIQPLKTSIDSLLSWKYDFEKRNKEFKTRLTKNRETLSRRCPNFHQNNVKHCFYCDFRG